MEQFLSSQPLRGVVEICPEEIVSGGQKADMDSGNLVLYCPLLADELTRESRKVCLQPVILLSPSPR